MVLLGAIVWFLRDDRKLHTHLGNRTLKMIPGAQLSEGR
jgi:hypothetical protein